MIYSILSSSVSYLLGYKTSPDLHLDIYREILKHLPIVDKIHLSLSCKKIKVIVESHLCRHALEMGYPSNTLPEICEAKKFFATLFKIIRTLRKNRILKETEIKYYKQSFWSFIYDPMNPIMDTESTLRNIPQLGVNRLFDLYRNEKFLYSEIIPSLHYFVLRNLPKHHLEIIEPTRQENLNSRLLRLVEFMFLYDEPLIKESYKCAVHMLLKLGANPNIRFPERFLMYDHTLLMIASKESDVTLVDFLLEYRADPNLMTYTGDQALHFASTFGRLEVIQSLIHRKADINHKGQYGRTPLLCALYNKNRYAAIHLLEMGADPNICDNNGDAPIHVAAKYSFIDVIKALLLKDVDINACGWEGRTPLLCAIPNHYDRNYNFGIVPIMTINVLIELGADPNIADINGNTSFDCAHTRGYTSIVEILGKAGAYTPIERLNLSE